MEEAWRRWKLSFKRSGPESANAPCPFCREGTDRFIIFRDGGYWCRQCNRTGWIDEEEEKDWVPPSPEEVMARRLAQLEEEQKRQAERIAALEQMYRSTDHLTYHNALTDETRQLWHAEGIYDKAIETFTLGFARQCPTFRQSASLTIPVLDEKSRLANIRHRLLEPKFGKYRPHRAGLGLTLFNANQLAQNPQERVVVLEGEKKAIVFCQFDFPAVGIMGKSAWDDTWYSLFDKQQRIVIALDPDAKAKAWQIGRGFRRRGYQNVRVAAFPVKPDDAFIKYYATRDEVEAILRTARAV
jgi:DNA primase